jgi:NAD(P)H-hydrate epimerase
MKIVTAAEMVEIDRRTSRKYGVPSLTLMENAGTAVADFVLANYPEAESVAVICGKGNNGGDGFVVARKVREAGKEVSVLLLANPKDLQGDAAKMFKQLPLEALPARREAELRRAAATEIFAADILIDAILGTGFHPPLSPLYTAAIEKMWKAKRPVIAVDIPSGMTADYDRRQPIAPRAPAAAIVTFTAPKPRLVFDRALASVATVVAHIGSPDQAITSSLGLSLTTASDALSTMPPRAPDSHKGNYGHVLIIGGSVGKSGAAAMAGIAALRSGAGLVTVAAPRSIVNPIAAHAPELMTEPLDETPDGTISLRNLDRPALERLLRGKTVIALGPGISTNSQTQEFVRRLIPQTDLPIVLDADGLNAFAAHTEQLSGRAGAGLILTPHPGEMARLAGCTIADVQNDRTGTARRFAVEHGIVLVLKGHRTLVAHPDGRIWVNTTGNPSLAKGGSGDVLTGMIAGLLAGSLGRELAMWFEFPKNQQRQGKALVAKLSAHAVAGKPAQLSARERKLIQPIVQKSRQLTAEHESLRLLMPAVAAVYLHGLAGDVARDLLDENSVLATDVIAALPEALRVARERAKSESKFVRIN